MSRDDLSKLVNRSGFPFQIGVEQHVVATEDEHGWRIEAHEYPWASVDGRSGFVDLVLRAREFRCIVECKRTTDATWIFLRPTQEKNFLGDSRAGERLLWAKPSAENGLECLSWDDLSIGVDGGARSEFCIVRGSSDDDKPMLERIASTVVAAAESLALEELRLKDRSHRPHIYLPVIVTNAELQVCTFVAEAVDLHTGEIPATARFEKARVVSFQKALPSGVNQAPHEYSTLRIGLKKKERNVFVVSIQHLADWLASVPTRLLSEPGPERFPWS